MARQCVNGKWLAQSPSGTQRYASEVLRAVAGTPAARNLVLVLPADAEVPSWATGFVSVRSRQRGVLFEQFALPWLTRGRHLYSMAGPAPLLKRNQTVVMHDAMPFRFPQTFRRAFVLWYWVMYGLLSRTARRVLTVSSFSQGELAQILRVPATRFSLAPCGSDHLDAEPAGALPFPRHSYALIVGNLAPHKNVEATASALADAGVPVAVVGMAQQIFRTAAVREDANIRVLGRVSDAELQRIYAGAGVLVAPSRYEGFCIPIVEAGRVGCPAVFARGSAMTEVAGDGGLGFDVDDLAECARLTRRVITEPALRQSLSAAALANAERFRWAATARSIFGAGDRPLRVLHVTETFSAGTGTAIIAYARAMQGKGVESYLLAQDRGSGLLDEVAGRSPFVEARLLPGGLGTLWHSLRGAVQDWQPDVVHLHSSFAGVVGRLQLPLPGHPTVVYSPHCFAFERRDIPRWRQRAYKVAEYLLARRTGAFVCVSPHEAQLAKGLRRGATVHEVLNAFDLGGGPPTAGTAHPESLRVVTVGRVAPQKNPAMFLDILRALRGRGAVETTWVGDGDEDVCAQLRADGVVVTGWLPAAEVPDAVAGHTVYLHTAGWEAAVPIAVLDAMIAGLPAVVKRNDAYRDILPQAWQFDDVDSAAVMIRRLADPDARRQRIDEQFELLTTLQRRSPDMKMADTYRQIVAAGSAGRTG